MYRKNNLLVGLWSIFAAIFAVNAFIMDAVATAHNLAWLLDWAKSVNLDRFVTELLNTAQNGIEAFGFLIIFFILICFVWR